MLNVYHGQDFLISFVFNKAELSSLSLASDFSVHVVRDAWRSLTTPSVISFSGISAIKTAYSCNGNTFCSAKSP